MRRAAILTLLLLAVLAVPPASADSPPPGATAKCRDGSYSSSQHHSGTCSHHGGVAAWLDGGATGGASTAAPAAVATGRTVLLAPRTRSRGCVRSARPDRRCSPGAYYTGLTKAVLCAPSFHTSSVRHVTQAEKFAVEREYGMTPKPYGRTIEIDHIVSLELGGSNDIANLYPEAGSGPESYHVKDRLENAAARLVCAGKLNLRTAQRAIASNWETLYAHVLGTVAGG